MKTNIHPALAALVKSSDGYFPDELIMASEGAIMDAGKRIATAFVNKFSDSTKENANTPIWKAIRTTNGDFVKSPLYTENKVCLDRLLSMSRNGGRGAAFVQDLETIRKYIVQQRPLFVKAFAKKNKITMQFYTSIGMIWMAGISFAISNCLDSANGNVTWKTRTKSSFNDASIVKMIGKISDDVTDGSLSGAIEKSFKGNVVANESVAVTIALGIMGGILLLIYFSRAVVMYFLDSRVKISDMLQNQSYFAKLIAVNNSKLDEAQRKKQLEYSEKLAKFASLIDVDLTIEDDRSLEKAITEDKNNIQRIMNDAARAEANEEGKEPSGGEPVKAKGLDF